MGLDLGFQRDPETWMTRSVKATSLPVENEFKRRIYWGCYMSDKYATVSKTARAVIADMIPRFISLVLGRPCVMHELDADVKPSQPLQ